MDTIEKAKELGIALSEHPSLAKLHMAEAMIEEEPEILNMVNDYQQKINFSKQLQFDPDADPEDVKKAVADMRSAAQLVNANKIAKNYMDSSQEFKLLMSKVNAVITHFLKDECSVDKCSKCGGGCG